jgi:hypothetical protein
MVSMVRGEYGVVPMCSLNGYFSDAFAVSRATVEIFSGTNSGHQRMDAVDRLRPLLRDVLAAEFSSRPDSGFSSYKWPSQR